MSRLAILGGSPVRTQPWPAWPARGPEDESALIAALREGDWGGYPMPNRCASRFASAFAQRHDCRFGQCVTNGTVALEVALQALGVEPGAEVIVPAYTFEATAAAALFSGCVPVFVDVDPNTYCINPAAAAAAVTERTQAIVPVHLAMLIADMDRLGELARRHTLAVLEDCAHAHGARWRDRGVGSLGGAGAFSFQTSKLMTAGEGGMVVTNDQAVMDRLYPLVNCGRQRSGAATEVQAIGHNYRLSELQAALLEVGLERLDQQHRARAENVAAFERALTETPGLSPLRRDPRITTQAIYQYVFRYDEAFFDWLPRDVFVAALLAEGVPCDGRFYESLTESPLLRRDRARYPAWAARPPDARCPVAERAAYHESVWLPHHLFLGARREVEDIVEAIQKVCANVAELRGADHPEIRRLSRPRSERSR